MNADQFAYFLPCEAKTFPKSRTQFTYVRVSFAIQTGPLGGLLKVHR
jgi:hypothetical protein